MTSLLTERSAAPRFLHLPERTSSAGQEAIELAASAGLILDPWEADCLDRALGERRDGKWSAFSVAIIVPRQNGKGSILEARELAGLFLFDERLILHSAHEFKTAAEAFLRVLMLIEQTPDLERRVQRVRKAHGEEAIELRSGQRLRFVARSTGSGRGFSGDTVIMDEAYNLSDKALAALLPTMATRPNAQLWYTSSAPLEGPESEVLRRICRRGRAGEGTSLAYMEFAADPDLPLDSHEAWAQANPGLHVRIVEEFIEREREELQDADFARERLGIWVDLADGSEWVIPSELWSACLNPKSGIVDDSQMHFALDIPPDRSRGSFAAVGPGREATHLEVIENRVGTDWIVSFGAELHQKWKRPIAIGENSPAWSMKDDLEQKGVELIGVSTAEHAQACGQLYDAVAQKRVAHIGQPELTKALAGAVKRFYGDAWLWSRKSSTVDISPLVACTLAFSQSQRGEESSVYEERGLVTLG